MRQNREWYWRNRDQQVIRVHEYKAKRNLKLYGIENPKEFFEELKKGDTCQVCCRKYIERSKKGMCIDHCHACKTYRGALCAPCNTALGLLSDSIENLEALKQYVIAHRQECNGLR